MFDLNESNKVGVLMSVMGQENVTYCESAIASVLEQDFQGEVVLYLVVDGMPSGGIKDLFDKLAGRPDVVVLYSDGSRLGLAARLNQLIDLALMDREIAYLARMDSDDFSLPSRFERQVQYLLANPTVDVVGTGVIEVDANDRELSYKVMDESDELLKKHIVRKCPFNHPTVMFRRRVFDDGARYDCSLMNTQDYYLWVELCAKEYVFANLPDLLLRLRIGNNFYKKRGWRKALNDFRAKLFAMRRLKKTGLVNCFYAFSILLLRLSPRWLQVFAYRYLRKGVERV
ncbi:glycosyltransferase [Saccharophagus degradans]|uniref:glycosyltransferase n=1 Tax=Saccharophagus degradans TaxID=86304 RepID=UPI003A7FD969